MGGVLFSMKIILHKATVNLRYYKRLKKSYKVKIINTNYTEITFIENYQTDIKMFLNFNLTLKSWLYSWIWKYRHQWSWEILGVCFRISLLKISVFMKTLKYYWTKLVSHNFYTPYICKTLTNTEHYLLLCTYISNQPNILLFSSC